AARDRAAQLEVMKRTTFPDRLNLEPANAQKVIGHTLVMGILVVVAFFFLVTQYNVFMRNSPSRRAAYMVVYKAVQSSKMSKNDKKSLENSWFDKCLGMYATDWTPWHLGLRPQPLFCETCHKVVKMRTRVLVAMHPPDKGAHCPATIEWSEL
ncbi:hypothetical protein PENTCL1PPCAC_12783, partial [Pristionchus entomophagus]